MSQNIYDDPGFFQAYSDLRRSRLGLDGAPEWPCIRSLLPPVRGLRIVDLGCGMGWFCRWAAQQGALSTVGIDLSEKMLAQARAQTTHNSITYRKGDLQQLDLSDDEFDLAYSSLALHYVEHVGRLLTLVHKALVPKGRFVFSIEHPIYMAPGRPQWLAAENGQKVWPLDGYQREGARVTDWLAPGVVKFHRTLGSTVNMLIDAGFSIRRLVEWRPTDSQVAANPSLAAEMERPTFAIISVER